MIESKPQKPTLLEVKNLRTHFFTEDGVVHAVDGVDLTIRSGEVLGLVVNRAAARASLRSPSCA